MHIFQWTSLEVSWYDNIYKFNWLIHTNFLVNTKRVLMVCLFGGGGKIREWNWNNVGDTKHTKNFFLLFSWVNNRKNHVVYLLSRARAHHTGTHTYSGVYVIRVQILSKDTGLYPFSQRNFFISHKHYLPVFTN